MSAEPKRDHHMLDFNTDSLRDLKKVMFDDRPGLAEMVGKLFEVQFTSRTGDRVYLLGTEENYKKVERAFGRLDGAMAGNSHISKDLIKKIASELNPKPTLSNEFMAANQNGKMLKLETKTSFEPKNQAQADFAKKIDRNDISFGLGPAGTGKTHVAMAKAIEGLKNGTYKKILLARPASEAGEKIGFLPGDQNDKLAPYMRPLYDELDKAFGHGKYKNMLSNGIIEVCAIGFMRGRTFEDCFVIVDEAQNCTIDQLKMATTRLGNGSKMVVTGDPNQVDLTPKESSGLKWMAEASEGVPGIAVQTFQTGDVMRHPTVKSLLEAIDRKEGLMQENGRVVQTSPKATPNKVRKPR